jgi:hypothetical protein
MEIKAPLLRDVFSHQPQRRNHSCTRRTMHDTRRPSDCLERVELVVQKERSVGQSPLPACSLDFQRSGETDG